MLCCDVCLLVCILRLMPVLLCRWCVHRDVAASVDALLSGGRKKVVTEIRTLDEHGRTNVSFEKT